MKTVHLMGIGGSAMASLAGMFVEKGWKVRGSDTNVYPPASLELARLGVEVREGFRPENLEPRPDLVVVGNVISRGNSEVEALLKTDIPFTSMVHALRDHFLTGRKSVVVCGTHGKTTTTSLLAWVLDQAGFDPGLFVGGIPIDYGRGFKLGKNGPFVVEGDEYNTAFFEKTPKFLHYKPDSAIVTSIEFDHADIYRDLPHVVEQFEKLVSILPSEGTLVACGESQTVRNVCSRAKVADLRWYGPSAHNDWRPMNFQIAPDGTKFDLVVRGKTLTQIHLPLFGRYNVGNAVAVLAMAEALGVAPDVAKKAIATFKGVRRRQEFLGESRGVKIYDDFAHHPTAIAETLAAFTPLAKASKGKLWAIFEPRSNTVRRRVFQKILPESFLLADEVILAPVYQKKDALGSEQLLQPKEVAESICGRGGKAQAAASNDEIVERLGREVQPGDVVVFMSNGSFGGIPRQVLEKIKAKASGAP